jgi:hypothetical protein
VFEAKRVRWREASLFPFLSGEAFNLVDETNAQNMVLQGHCRELTDRRI